MSFQPVCQTVRLKLKVYSTSYKKVVIAGLVFGAESALQRYENLRRREGNVIRREARLDLARRGLIATETEIANWKAEKERQSTT